MHYLQIVDIKSLYKEYRQNITDEYHVIFQHAIRMAEAVNTQPSQPRVAGKQMHRQNTKADTPEEYYLKNLGIPFTDHLIMELDEQFSGKMQAFSERGMMKKEMLAHTII